VTDIGAILAKPAKAQAFNLFLVERGCDVLPASNEWELLRFRAGRRVNVVYRDKRGALSPVGPDIAPAVKAFATSGPWRAEPTHPRKKDSARRRHLRAALLKRDGDECFYCGLPLDDAGTFEDLLSVTHGGRQCLANLALAHQSCNVKAGHLSIVEKVRMRERMRTGRMLTGK